MRPSTFASASALLLASLVAGQYGVPMADDESTGAGSNAGQAASEVLFQGYNAYGVPIYPTSAIDLFTNTPAVGSNASLAWGTDPGAPTNGSLSAVRPDHPRLFAPAQRWERLPALIAADPYLAAWNKTIFDNATAFYSMPPTNYSIDGGLSGSGVLDVAREVQLRIKHWAYAYRMTNDTRWSDRVWEEVLVASGNTTQYFGVAGDNWNTDHWLDVGEFIVAFAYAYDWLYDAWNQTQRDAIMWSIIELGLEKGVAAYSSNAWFLTTNGNWNCVTNGGMIVGSLAIYHEDPTGTAASLLTQAVSGAKANCAMAVQADGTWSETSDYWYFGSQGHAQMASALLTATGSSQDLLTINPAFNNTGLFHMYVYGNTYKFNYGDCGPNKYTATANPLLFYGDQFDIPMYTLYQRDRADAPDPLSMFWYNPEVTGGWFVDLPLDRNFDNPNDAWVSMRSSWTDTTGLFAAMKAGNLTGHQTHGDLDAGDFVIDAIGERWAGQLCQNNYLDTGYFSSEASDSQRWLYYRCRTEGQNTLLYNGLNQAVDAAPTATYGSTAEQQTAITFQSGSNSAAYWIADLTAAYNGTAIKRGMRLLDSRTQVLVQDEITGAAETSQWRMHTNASISMSNNNQTATLTLNGTSMFVTLQSPTSAAFTTLSPDRLSADPPLPSGQTDLPNPGVTVLAIDVPAGTQTVAVLFSPLWNSSCTVLAPSLVALDSWSLTSHPANASSSCVASDPAAANASSSSSSGSKGGKNSGAARVGAGAVASAVAVAGLALAVLA
jgi:hypothetical protein